MDHPYKPERGGWWWLVAALLLAAVLLAIALTSVGNGRGSDSPTPSSTVETTS